MEVGTLALRALSLNPVRLKMKSTKPKPASCEAVTIRESSPVSENVTPTVVFTELPSAPESEDIPAPAPSIEQLDEEVYNDDVDVSEPETPPATPAPQPVVQRRGRLSVGGSLAQRMFAAMTPDAEDVETEEAAAPNTGAATCSTRRREPATEALRISMSALTCDDLTAHSIRTLSAGAWSHPAVNTNSPVDESVPSGKILVAASKSIVRDGFIITPNLHSLFYHIAKCERHAMEEQCAEREVTRVGPPKRGGSRGKKTVRKTVIFSNTNLSTLKSAPNPDVRSGTTHPASSCDGLDTAVSLLADVLTAANAVQSELSCSLSDGVQIVCGCVTGGPRACPLGSLLHHLTTSRQNGCVDSHAAATLRAELCRLKQREKLLPFELPLSNAMSAVLRFRLRRALNPSLLPTAPLNDWASLRLGETQMKYALQDVAAITHKALRTLYEGRVLAECVLDSPSSLSCGEVASAVVPVPLTGEEEGRIGVAVNRCTMDTLTRIYEFTEAHRFLRTLLRSTSVAASLKSQGFHNFTHLLTQFNMIDELEFGVLSDVAALSSSLESQKPLIDCLHVATLGAAIRLDAANAKRTRKTAKATGDGVPQQLKDVVFPEVVVGFPPAAAPECGIDPLNTATSEDTTLAPCDSEKKTAGKKGGGKGRKKQTSAPTAAVPVCESSCPVCSCGVNNRPGSGSIMCNGCDTWLHLKCLDLPEDYGDFVPQFYCQACAIGRS